MNITQRLLVVACLTALNGCAARSLRTAPDEDVATVRGSSRPVKAPLHSLTLGQLMARATVYSTDVAGPKGTLLFAGQGDTFLTGGAGNDTIYGWGNNDTLTAGTGNTRIYGESTGDVLRGGVGSDTLEGFGAKETMIGGSGNTTFIVNHATDVIIQQPHTGTDTVLSSVSYEQPQNVQNLSLTGSASVVATGNQQTGVLTGNAGRDTLISGGGSGNHILVAGSGIDTLLGGGGAGTTTFVVNNPRDIVRMSSGSGMGIVDASVNYTLPPSVDVLHLTGAGLVGVANNENDVLSASGGPDTLVGGSGVDVLKGGSGHDVLIDHKGAAIMLGGAGGAIMDVGSINPSFLGVGHGGATVSLRGLGSMAAFNRGDGALTIQANTVGLVLSLGGGIRERALRFSKQGPNLVLTAGGQDKITVRDWYTAPTAPIYTLQIIERASVRYAPDSPDELVNHKVVIFNFDRLVTAFNQARAARPGLTSWALAHGLVAAYQGGHDAAAIGGDLAYYFGRHGDLRGMDLRAARRVLLNPKYDTGLQVIHPWAVVTAPGLLPSPTLP